MTQLSLLHILTLFFLALAPDNSVKNSKVSVLVLGVAQDAGYPQIACQKECCQKVYKGQAQPEYVTSLAVIDEDSGEAYLFEASPDISKQLKILQEARLGKPALPNGIFISHAHIGHYTGLMHLGREAMSANAIPVYVMPRMKNYLENNGPWSQLVELKNISLNAMQDNIWIAFENFSLRPFLVPHRDEYSETVGFEIKGPNKKVIFIPDIDKWDNWETNIEDLVLDCDYAFIDATFYDGSELPNRNIEEVPHPFVVETMNRFRGYSKEIKSRIKFIHLNHTNPLLDPGTQASQNVLIEGYKISFTGMRVQI